MLDSRGFPIKVGDEVLVVQHKNQIELAGTIITTRGHHPFNTVLLGTIIALDKFMCRLGIGSRQIVIKGDSENGWYDRIFLLPQQGAE